MSSLLRQNIAILADGNIEAEQALTKQVLEWGIGGRFLFIKVESYPAYFRGERIAGLARIFASLDPPHDSGKTLREFMRFLLWQKRDLPGGRKRVVLPQPVT